MQYWTKKDCSTEQKRAGLGPPAPFPKSRASYFRFASFNTSPLYYLRAWQKLTSQLLFPFSCVRSLRENKLIPQNSENKAFRFTSPLIRNTKRCIIIIMDALLIQWRIQGRGPLLFLDQNEARRDEKKFLWGRPPPALSQRQDDRPLLIWRSGSATKIWAKILAFHPENFKWDQNLKFLTLRKMTKERELVWLIST